MTTQTTNPAEQAFDTSRRSATAGLAVRWADHLLTRPAGRHGTLCVVIVPAENVSEVGPAVAAERGWAYASAVEKVSAPQCLRQLARKLDADHTGTRDQLIAQIHAPCPHGPAGVSP